MENRGQQLKEVFPSIKEKVLLKDFSTFRIGGIADYILETGDSSEVIKAISFCRESDIAFCVIGLDGSFRAGRGPCVVVSEESRH